MCITSRSKLQTHAWHPISKHLPAHYAPLSIICSTNPPFCLFPFQNIFKLHYFHIATSMWHNYKYINVGWETKRKNVNIIDSLNFEECCAPYFITPPIQWYFCPSKWWVGGSLDKAIPPLYFVSCKIIFRKILIQRPNTINGIVMIYEPICLWSMKV